MERADGEPWSLVRSTMRPSTRRRDAALLFGLLAVVAATVVACGEGDRAESDDAVGEELGRVAAWERGRPALVFVYTDG